MNPDPVQTEHPPVTAVLAERIGFLFAKLHHRWHTDSASLLRDAGLGLSGLHFGAMSVIAASAPISQQGLGELLKKDRTTVVALVDELEGSGLVERQRNPDDRRAYALQVTAAGEDWLRRARTLLITAEDQMLTELDADEREVLVGLLQRVYFSAPPGC